MATPLPRRSMRGLRAPRVAVLSGLGAAPWEAPLRPEELPSGLLFIHPRYALKVVNDLLDDKVSLAQCEAWSADPPDWVKKKNKLGQDSFRLACFIRHRLNHRIPKNWFDSQLDSDASLIIEGRRKYDDLPIDTLARWSTQAPNWKPWNRDKDLTAVVMPAFLWARKIASARAGVDIPFFVDSAVEDLSDKLVAAQEKSLLTVLEVICNIAATYGIGAATGGGAAVAKEGVKEGTKQGIKETATESLKKSAANYVTQKAKSAGTQVVREAAKEIDSSKGREAAIAAGSGVVGGGVAVAGALIAGGPIGWVAIAALAAAPLLCWGLKEAALKLIKDNLRDWVPDFVPQFITSVYAAQFGAQPTPEQVAELDQRYSWAISANSIAKAVASPENNPLIIDAVSQRQTLIRAAISASVTKLTGCVPNPVRVAEVANRAFNDLWDEKRIADYVSANRAFLCKLTLAPATLARTAALRSGLAVQAAGNIVGVKPIASANVSVSDKKGGVIPRTLPNPPKKQAAGIGAALALATGGFFVGGPVGAGIGFVVGLAAGGKKA